MTLFSVRLILSLLQKILTINSVNLVQHDDLRVTQILATHSYSLKNFKLRQYSLTRVQKYRTPVPSEIEFFRTFASVYVCARAKKPKLFAAPQLV